MTNLTCPTGMKLIEGSISLQLPIPSPEAGSAPHVWEYYRETVNAYASHSAWLSALPPYCIDRHEVTNAEYDRYEANQSSFKIVADGEIEIRNITQSKRPKPGRRFAGPNQPVIEINWYEAEAYCVAKGGHLPTGDQWEKGAKGPQGKILHTPTHAEANFDSKATVDVESYPPNDYGVYDMVGNVEEWILDEDEGCGVSMFKSQFGSSWRSTALFIWDDSHANGMCRYREPLDRDDEVGFRCVVEAQLDIG